MRLYEFEGCKLFQSEGIPVARYAMAASPQEARGKAEEIGLPVVIKAQVLTGGRWLAGGVQSAATPAEAEEVTRRIMENQLLGFTVKQVMVSQKVEIAREFYVGITVDEYHGTPVAVLSVEDGVAVNRLVIHVLEAFHFIHVAALDGGGGYGRDDDGINPAISAGVMNGI